MTDKKELQSIHRYYKDCEHGFSTPYGYYAVPIMGSKTKLMLIHDGQMFRDADVVKREGKLYNKSDHTFEFSAPVFIDATYLYDFEDIPSVFQRYIISKASTRAATQLVGDANLARLLQTQEAQNRANVMEYDTQQGDHSFFGFREEQGYDAYQPYKALIR